MPSEGGFPPLADYTEWLSMDRHYRHHQPRIDPALSYPELVRSFLAQMKEHEGAAHKRMVGVAVHRHFDRLLRVWPEARLLHLVRDPRDVARSWIEFGWSGNAWAAAREWRELEQSWRAVAAKLPHEQVFELRFEDLVADPPNVLARVCAFLGLPYSDEMLRYHEHSTYGPVDPAQVAKWRSALSPTAQRLMEGELGAFLDAHGYERCGLPPYRAGAFAARLLALDDRFQRWRVRVRTYGLRVWICDQIALALGLEAWHRKLELQRQAIMNANLK
jgi:hypothetical protein